MGNERNRNRWFVLAVVSVAQLMVVLDGTIVNIALPQAQAQLGMSDAQRTWVVTVYALFFGGLLLLGGQIADYWGRKRTFLVGLVGFAAASMLGGMATGSEALILARGLQGGFGALLAPAALAILTLTFPSGRERVRAFAVYGAISGSGATLGLLLGGALTEYVSWHWCLLVNVPIAVIAGLAGGIVLTDSRAEGDRSYDLPGTVLAVGGLASLVYGFAEAEYGWLRPTTLGFLALGVVLLVIFVVVEDRSPHPLLPLRILRDRTRAGAFIVSTTAGMAILGAMLFLTFYLQITKGFSPLQSGLASAPLAASILVAAPLLTRLLPRIGARLPMTLGPIAAAIGLFWLSTITVESDYLVTVLPGLIIYGIGMALLFVPLQNLALAGVEPRDAGVAGALVNATQQVGGSVGTSLFTALYATVTAWALAGAGGEPTVLQRSEALVAGYSAAFVAAGVLLLACAPVSCLMIRADREVFADTREATMHVG